MTPDQRLIVMAFGGIIVVASLFLLFLKKDEGQNRVKLFGQEFEISTPSLVVFLAGCGIFVMPFFLPHEEQIPVPPEVPVKSDTSTTSNSGAAHQPTTGQENNTIVLPSHPTGVAKEPNDGIYDATAIVFGSSIKGKLTERDPVDWYVFKTPDDVSEEILVIFRYIDGGWGHVEVYDVNENRINDAIFVNSTRSFNIKTEQKAVYYIKVQSQSKDATNYELEVRNKST
jgi:predicted nucleotidyltransferase